MDLEMAVGIAQRVPCGIVLRESKTLLQTISSVLTVFIQGKKTNLNLFGLFRILFQNALNSKLASFLRRVALAHKFNNKVTTDDTDNLFTNACRCSCPYLIINIESCADDRGITNTSMHLVSHTACGASARQVSI